MTIKGVGTLNKGGRCHTKTASFRTNLLVCLTILLSTNLYRNISSPCNVSSNGALPLGRVRAKSTDNWLGTTSSQNLLSGDATSVTGQLEGPGKAATKASGLPQRIFTVFGLESSGTTFVYSALSKAVGAQKSGDQESTTSENVIHVQHVSLPTGYVKKTDIDWEHRYEALPIVPTMVPDWCSMKRSQNPKGTRPAPERCSAFGENLMVRPSRFFVNVTSHVNWYRQHGVDAQAIVVVREPALHFRGIVRIHCPNETAAYQQYQTGQSLLRHAMAHLNPPPLVISYESLMTLQMPYLKELYQALGITSNYAPKFSNGNIKYVSNDTIPSSISDKLLADQGTATHVQIPDNQYIPRKPGDKGV